VQRSAEYGERVGNLRLSIIHSVRAPKNP